jgi:hypothetical protein
MQFNNPLHTVHKVSYLSGLEDIIKVTLFHRTDKTVQTYQIVSELLQCSLRIQNKLPVTYSFSASLH